MTAEALLFSSVRGFTLGFFQIKHRSEGSTAVDYHFANSRAIVQHIFPEI